MKTLTWVASAGLGAVLLVSTGCGTTVHYGSGYRTVGTGAYVSVGRYYPSVYYYRGTHPRYYTHRTYRGMYYRHRPYYRTYYRGHRHYYRGHHLKKGYYVRGGRVYYRKR